MKKFVCMMMVVVTILTMSVIAHGEGRPAEFEPFAEQKVFQTEGKLEGTWTIGLQRDENNRYPCVLDLGDGRYISVPLTDDEVNDLMCKALKEHDEAVKAAAKAERRANQNGFQRAVDWITFWD